MSDIDSENEAEDDFKRDDSNVLVAIDCSEKMFKPLEIQGGLSGFQVALRSTFNVVDSLLLRKSPKNKLAIIFFHPNAQKRILIDFESNSVEGFIELKKLAFSSLDDLADYKRTSYNEYAFSYFLTDCTKMFRKVNRKETRSFLFVTNDDDPCGGDANAKVLTESKFTDFKELKIDFELLPVVDDFDCAPFFEAAFRRLEQPCPKNYYELEFLTAKIQEAIKQKFASSKIKLYLTENEDLYIQCVSISYCKDAKLLPNINLTRDFQSEAIKEIEQAESEQYRLHVGSNITPNDITLDESQKKSLYETNVKQGLTIIDVSKNRISQIGESLDTPRTVRPSNVDDAEFNDLWVALVQSGLTLLCTRKFSVTGRVRYVELIPKMVNRERHLLMVAIPTAVDMYKPKASEVHLNDNDRSAKLLTELVKQATIDDYDASRLRPIKYDKMVTYFKKELLGQDYVEPNKSVDFINEKLYKEDLGDLVAELQRLYPDEQDSKKRGKKGSAPATKKVKK